MRVCFSPAAILYVADPIVQMAPRLELAGTQALRSSRYPSRVTTVLLPTSNGIRRHRRLNQAIPVGSSSR
jgi:hypothetical protein